jgi:hypothetical protein
MPVKTLEVTPMAKRKAGRPKGKTPPLPGLQVRIDRDIVAKAKVVASRRNLDVGPLISQLIEPVINREYAAVLRELAELERSK